MTVVRMFPRRTGIPIRLKRKLVSQCSKSKPPAPTIDVTIVDDVDSDEAARFDPLTVLPAELKCLIFENLPYLSRIASLSVSRSWHDFFMASPQVWRDLDLAVPSTRSATSRCANTARIVALLQRVGKLLRTLDLYVLGLTGTDANSLISVARTVAPNKFQNLIRFALTVDAQNADLCNNSIVNLCSVFGGPKLRHLHLGGTLLMGNDLAPILKWYRTIKTLSLPNSKISMGIDFCLTAGSPVLRELNLGRREIREIPHWPIAFYTRMFPHLEQLDLRGFQSWRRIFLPISFHVTFTELELSYSEMVDDVHVNWLLDTSHDSLEVLRIQGAERLSAAALHAGLTSTARPLE
ncbi:hypothetical protein GGF32_006328 [Allomyces javanicus]|nr:hypothetical protein GGF32_006328 [Allomyces javanicus]